MCKVNFPATFRDPQRLPKRRRKIYLAHRAKTKNQLLFYTAFWRNLRTVRKSTFPAGSYVYNLHYRRVGEVAVIATSVAVWRRSCLRWAPILRCSDVSVCVRSHCTCEVTLLIVFVAKGRWEKVVTGCIFECFLEFLSSLTVNTVQLRWLTTYTWPTFVINFDSLKHSYFKASESASSQSSCCT